MQQNKKYRSLPANENSLIGDHVSRIAHMILG